MTLVSVEHPQTNRAIPTLKQMGGSMSVEHPQTRIWLCVRCGERWEMLPGALPGRDIDGRVLCVHCAELPLAEVQL